MRLSNNNQITVLFFWFPFYDTLAFQFSHFLWHTRNQILFKPRSLGFLYTQIIPELKKNATQVKLLMLSFQQITTVIYTQNPYDTLSCPAQEMLYIIPICAGTDWPVRPTGRQLQSDRICNSWVLSSSVKAKRMQIWGVSPLPTHSSLILLNYICAFNSVWPMHRKIIGGLDGAIKCASFVYIHCSTNYASFQYVSF